MITQSQAKNLFNYNHKTGELRRKSTGKLCSTKRHRGKLTYYQTTVKYKSFLVHRIAYLIYYGFVSDVLDHINGIGTDNRISNLRDGGDGVNSQNRTISYKSKTNIKGVLYRENRGDYQVTICNKYIGYSKSLFEAACIRMSMENKINYKDRI